MDNYINNEKVSGYYLNGELVTGLSKGGLTVYRKEESLLEAQLLVIDITATNSSWNCAINEIELYHQDVKLDSDLFKVKATTEYSSYYGVARLLDKSISYAYWTKNHEPTPRILIAVKNVSIEVDQIKIISYKGSYKPKNLRVYLSDGDFENTDMDVNNILPITYGYFYNGVNNLEVIDVPFGATHTLTQ